MSGDKNALRKGKWIIKGAEGSRRKGILEVRNVGHKIWPATPRRRESAGRVKNVAVMLFFEMQFSIASSSAVLPLMKNYDAGMLAPDACVQAERRFHTFKQLHLVVKGKHVSYLFF